MAREVALERAEKERLQASLAESQEVVERLQRKLDRAREELKSRSANLAADASAARDAVARARVGSLSPEEADKLRERLKSAEEKLRAHRADAARKAKALAELREETAEENVGAMRAELAEARRAREAAEDKCGQRLMV